LTSIFSLRKHYSGEVTVMQEGLLDEGVARLIGNLDAKVQQIPEIDVPGLFRKASLWRELTCDYAMFLDSDTIIRGPVDEFLEWTMKWGFTCTWFSGWLTSRPRVKSRIQQWNRVDSSLIPPALAYGKAINSGVQGWSKQATILPEYERLTQLGISAGCNRLVVDEIALQLLLPTHTHYLADHVWNTSGVFGNVEHARIVHYHGRKHCHPGNPRTDLWTQCYFELLNSFPGHKSDLQNPWGDRRFGTFLSNQVKLDRSEPPNRTDSQAVPRDLPLHCSSREEGPPTIPVDCIMSDVINPAAPNPGDKTAPDCCGVDGIGISKRDSDQEVPLEVVIIASGVDYQEAASWAAPTYVKFLGRNGRVFVSLPEGESPIDSLKIHSDQYGFSITTFPFRLISEKKYTSQLKCQGLFFATSTVVTGTLLLFADADTCCLKRLFFPPDVTLDVLGGNIGMVKSRRSFHTKNEDKPWRLGPGERTTYVNSGVILAASSSIGLFKKFLEHSERREFLWGSLNDQKVINYVLGKYFRKSLLLLNSVYNTEGCRITGETIIGHYLGGAGRLGKQKRKLEHQRMCELTLQNRAEGLVSRCI
jgi:hypothetical protein